VIYKSQMVVVEIVNDDLLNAKEVIICHQCNCTTSTPAGLALSIVKKYPSADVYKHRTKQSTPGTITLISIDDKRSVIAMFAQINPSYPLNADSTNARKYYFQQCLDEIDSMKLNECVAMPYLIGCGMAGGNWNSYLEMLERCNTNIVLYKI